MMLTFYYLPVSLLVCLLVAVLLPAEVEGVPFLKPIWTSPLPYGPPAGPLVALSQNSYYVADVNGTLWAIETEATHAIKWSLRWDDLAALFPFADLDVLLVQVSQGLWAMNASTGRLLWLNNTIQPTAPIARIGENFIVFNENAAGSPFIMCFSLISGAYMWSVPMGSIYTSQPLVDVGLVFASANLNGNATLVAFNGSTGAVAWQGPFGSVVGVGHGIVVTTLGTDLYLLDAATGKVCGHYLQFVQPGFNHLVMTADGHIAVTDGVSVLAMFEAATCGLLWKVALAHIPPLVSGILSLTVTQSHVIAISIPPWTVNNQFNNITAFNRTTGDEAWAIITPPSLATLIITFLPGCVVVPNTEGYMAFSESTGAVINRSTEPLPFLPVTARPLGVGSQFVAQDVGGSVSSFAVLAP